MQQLAFMYTGYLLEQFRLMDLSASGAFWLSAQILNFCSAANYCLLLASFWDAEIKIKKTIRKQFIQKGTTNNIKVSTILSFEFLETTFEAADYFSKG